MGAEMNGPGTSRGGHGGPISAGDRVSSVIARDERLIDVFTSLSPAFERLRNPAMRKVMSRLVTVEQAARMAGVDPNELVARLNAAVGAGEGGGGDAGAAGASASDAAASAKPGASEASPATAASAADAHTAPAGPPPALARIPEDLIVDLDVRDDLRQGREPFSKIMATRRSVPAGGVLRLRAIFEPVPLYAVMSKQGFAHWTERFAEDDWRVWFYPAEAEGASAGAAPGGAPAEAEPADAGSDDVVVLDVRGLEPPEPMMRTLETIERLPPHATLVQINSRVPQLLLPLLEARGYAAEVREETPGVVRVFIRRRVDG